MSHMNNVEAVNAAKKRNARVLLLAALSTIGSQVILMQATPQILLKHYKGNGAKTVLALGQMTSAAAMIEFMLNPLFGSLSDSIGRKIFLYLAPIATIICRALVAKNPTPTTVAFGRLITGALVPAFMTALSASCTDMYLDDSQALVKLVGQVQVVGGVALVAGSVLGGRLAAKDIRLPYAVSASLGAVGLALVGLGYEESLPARRRTHFKLGMTNPLSFLKLFQRGPALAKLAAVYALQLLPLNMGDTESMFAREVRKWGPQDIGSYSATQGLTFMISGALMGTAVKKLGRQNLAASACLATLLAMIGAANANTTQKAYACLLLLGAPGQTRLAPVEASLTAAASKLGIGSGQLAAEKANLSAGVRALGPLLCGWAYALGQKHGVPGLHYYVVAVFLAIARLLISSQRWDV